MTTSYARALFGGSIRAATFRTSPVAAITTGIASTAMVRET
jgi:hypothetical protein